MWAKKRPHEWLGEVLGVLGLAPSAHISQIIQNVIKGYEGLELLLKVFLRNFSFFSNYTSPFER